MTELILKEEIGDDKLKALLDFLKTWGVDVEVRNRDSKKAASVSQKDDFPFSIGLWDDYEIDDKTLRQDAWKKDVV
ncbi:hypothetical protein [Petrimonas sp.]|uniref:hypothetical protein n=1 Tax=Petrimonas sp. TaxID=2023866 RepID=UPI003F5160ED